MRVARRVAARAARRRASFFHWGKDGSPLGLQQHHDEPGRLRVAGVATHDVDIGRAFVERLPRTGHALRETLAGDGVDAGIR